MSYCGCEGYKAVQTVLDPALGLLGIASSVAPVVIAAKVVAPHYPEYGLPIILAGATAFFLAPSALWKVYESLGLA